MDEDDRSSLGSFEELGVAVGFVLEEIEKVIFEVFSMMRRNRMIFSCPTDDTRGCPTENAEGS